MINVKIRYYMGIESLTGRSHETVSFQGDSVGELIKDLLEKYPSFKPSFVGEEGLEPAPGLSILVNGKEIMWLQQMSTPLRDGDEVTFLRFVAGGSGHANLT